MSEKKKYVLNCDVCDTRKIVEDNYKDYETIIINADVLVQNEQSKAILSRLPIEMNADRVLEIEGDDPIHRERSNGNYEIGTGTRVSKNTILTVNGNLTIVDGCEEVLKNYVFISVNGNVRYPENLNAELPPMVVNGPRTCYPEGAIVLKERFQPDKYFAMRAKEGNIYYAENVVFLTDLEVDVKALKEKQIRFITKKFVIAEEFVEDGVALFDEQVEMSVVPAGYVSINENVELNRSLLANYGTKLDINGVLTVREDGMEELATRVQQGEEADIRAEDTLEVVHRLVDRVENLPISYKKLEEVKGHSVKGQATATVDHKTLELYPDGVVYKGIGAIKIAQDITPEEITELLEFRGVGAIRCSKEQASAVHTVSSGVGSIGGFLHNGDGESDSETTTEMSLFDLIKKGIGMMKDSKLVNADDYVM